MILSYPSILTWLNVNLLQVIFVKLCTPRKKTTSSPTAHVKTVRTPTPQHVRAPGTPVRPRPQPWLKRQHKQQQQQEALQAQLQANASRAAASNPTSPARRMSPPPPFYSNRLPNTPPTSPFTFEYPSCPSPRRKLGTSKEGWVWHALYPHCPTKANSSNCLLEK